MASQSDILKEYLLALGFKVDSKSAKTFEETTTKFDKRVVGLAKATLAAGAAAQALAVKFSSSMEQLYYRSRLSETVADRLQSVAFGASQVGISADSMKGSIEGMARAMRLNPGLSGLLRDLGVKVEGRNKADVMLDLVGALRKMPFYQAAQYAQLFGIDPDQLLLLEDGLEKLKAAASLREKMAKDAGLDMTKASEAGLQYANTLGVIKERTSVLLDLMAVKMLPLFQSSASWLDQTLSNLTKVIGRAQTLGDLGRSFVRGAGRIADDVRGSSFWDWFTTPLATGQGGYLARQPGPRHKASGTVTGSSGAVPPAMNLPLGLRQNNPGNLRSWGSTPVLGGFANFGSAEAGLAAMAQNLQGYGRRGVNSVDAIINRWAPSSENDTASYIRSVAGRMGVKSGEALDLNNPEVLSKLMGAMIQHEQGMNPFTASQLQTAAGGRPVTITQQNTYTITSPDPQAAGRAVQDAQNRSNADLVRNLGSSKVN